MMPHLRFRGMKLEELKEISAKLLDDLERIVESPRDYFTLELEASTFVFDGQEGGNQYPLYILNGLIEVKLSWNKW